jgi:hypothetical protein
MKSMPLEAIPALCFLISVISNINMMDEQTSEAVATLGIMKCLW